METESTTKTKRSGSAQTGNYKEGPLAREIEDKTARLPSDVFLWSSVSAMGVSLLLKTMGKNNLALFVGQWAAPFLLLGIYNKLVKLEGHDQTDKAAS